jgi:hypothetical protein
MENLGDRFDDRFGDRFGDRLAWIAAGVIFLGILITYDAHASPLSGEEQQCSNLSRYALVARSLAEARVDKQAARGVLDKMYKTDERGSQLASLVLDLAYREKSFAGVFATQFEAACLGKRPLLTMPERLPGNLGDGKALVM